MKRIILSLLVLAVAITGMPATSAAGDGAPTLNRVVSSGTLRVGMSGNQPPFNMVSKSGEVIGFDVDLANMLASAMGVELEIVTKPFPELLPALEKGEVDAVMSGLTMTPKRNLKAAFVGPYMVSGKSILTKSTTLAAISEAEELDRSSLTVVALKGSTSQRFAEKVMDQAKLVTTDDYDAAVKMLLADEADALVADFPICALTSLRYPEANLATLTKPLTIEPIGIALPPGDSLLLNMVGNYFGTLEGLGVLELLEKKWFEDGAWLIQLP